jgi:hypothetical protein
VTTSTANESAILANHAQDLSAFTTTPAPSDSPLQSVPATGSELLAISETPNYPTESTNTQNFTSPKSARSMGLFLEYLHKAIMKTGDSADITISLSLSVAVSDGYLRLGIVPSRANFLAMKLLGKNVESHDQQRYVVDEHGRKSFPEPNIKLVGGPAAALSEFFGPLLLSGIAESTQRNNEIRDGLSDTECVYMRVSCDPRDCVYLYITMGSSTLFSVYMHCFGQY